MDNKEDTTVNSNKNFYDIEELPLERFLYDFKENTENKTKKYCFVLGSGASFSSGIRTGSEIAKIWIEDLKKFHRCKNLNKLNEKYLNINGLNENNFAEHYSEIFDRRYLKGSKEPAYDFFEKEMLNKQPSIGYFYLSEILANTEHNVVITTNFDTLTEDALFRFTNKKSLLCVHESLASFINYKQKKPIIAKIHNDLFFKPKTSQNDIGSLSKEWEEALTKILNMYVPIFVGYGGNDPSLMNFLEKFYVNSKDDSNSLIWCYKGNSEPQEKIKNLLKISNGSLCHIEGFDDFFLKLFISLENNPIKTINDFKSKNNIFYSNLYNTLEQNTYEKITSLNISKNLKEDKGSIYYLNLLSEKISKNKNNENDAEIEKIIKEAENNKVTNEFFYNNLGVLYSDQKNYTEAAKMYKKAIELDPNYINAYNNFGNLYNNQKKYVEAKNMYLKAIKLNPNYIYAYNNFGVLYCEQKNYTEAAKMYKKAIELDPNYINAYNNFGILYYDQKNYTEAEKMYKKAIELDPKYIDTYSNLGNLYFKQGNYGEAEKIYKKAIELDPKYIDTYNNFGILYCEQKNYTEAAKMYKKAIELDPNYINAYNNFGILYYDQKNYTEAEKMYKKAIELDPKYIDTYSNLGNLHFKQGNYGEAKKMYLKAIELDPDFFSAYAGLGILYCEQKKYDESEKMFLKAIEINDSDINTLTNYLQLLFITKNATKISEIKEKIIKLINTENYSEDYEKQAILEFYFYLYMHEEKNRIENYNKIIELLNEGIRSENWDFSQNIEAIKNTHPDIEKVKLLSEIINNKKSIDELDK